MNTLPSACVVAAVALWGCSNGGATEPSRSPGAHLEAGVPVDSAVPSDSAASSPADAAAYGDPLANLGAVELVQDGFGRIEGPAWSGDALYFSDIEGNRIHRLDASGTVTVFREPSDNSNGLGFDPAGLLLACEQSAHRVTRTLADGSVVVVADHWQGKVFNAPNDVAVRKDGTLYFTDPGFDFPTPAAEAPPYMGVYRVDPSGSLSLVTSVLDRPNGVTLSIDEKTLYVDETFKADVQALSVNPDGTTGDPAPFVTTELIPDGMCIDDAANLYVTTASGIQVFSRDGSMRGVIPMPSGVVPQNCAFGGADRRTLYVAGGNALYAVRMTIPGRPF